MTSDKTSVGFLMQCEVILLRMHNMLQKKIHKYTTRVLPFYTPCIFLKSLCILQRYFMNTIFLKKRLFLFVLWICVWSGGAVDWWMPDETDFDTFGRIFFTKNVMANSRKNSDIFCHSVCWIIAKIHYPIPFFVHYVIIPG